MPSPKQDETRQEFLNRCTEYIIEKEDKDADVAYAMCVSIWDKEKENNTAKFSIKRLYNKYMKGVNND